MTTAKTESSESSPHSQNVAKEILGAIDMDNYAAQDCLRTKDLNTLKIILERQALEIKRLLGVL